MWKHLCCFGLRSLLVAGLREDGCARDPGPARRWVRPPPRPVLAESTSIHRGHMRTDEVLPCVVSASHSSVAPSLTVVSSDVSTDSNLLNGAAEASAAQGGGGGVESIVRHFLS